MIFLTFKVMILKMPVGCLLLTSVNEGIMRASGPEGPVGKIFCLLFLFECCGFGVLGFFLWLFFFF